MVANEMEASRQKKNVTVRKTRRKHKTAINNNKKLKYKRWTHTPKKIT